MRKYVVIPDSFKGTISSVEACSIMEQSIKKIEPDAKVIKIPIADGGEGTVDAFLYAMGGKKISVLVNDPYMFPITAEYGILSNGKTAVIEVAACAGLSLVENNNQKNPLKTSTYGVGELILHAVQNGCSEIIIGLGGTCTNDFGAGLLSALGIKFFNKNNECFIPTGETLCEITKIDNSKSKQLLKKILIVAMCDVTNPMFGTNGAAFVYGRQKGADDEMIVCLDRNLEYLAKLIVSDFGIDVQKIVGAGAAGGIGGGLAVFLDATLKSGIDVVLDAVSFDSLLFDVTAVFTGEGRIDNQSAQGKVISGIAKRTKEAKVTLIAVAGAISDPVDELYEIGVTAIFSINRAAIDFSHAQKFSKYNLGITTENIVRILK